MSKFTSLEETTLRSRGNLRMPYNKTSGCEADICFHSSVHEQIHQSRRDDSAQQREFANALQHKTSGCEADISLFHENIQKLFKT